jgi:hypothetical protein
MYLPIPTLCLDYSDGPNTLGPSAIGTFNESSVKSWSHLEEMQFLRVPSDKVIGVIGPVAMIRVLR